MGVPKFFRWLAERYPLLQQEIAGSQIPKIDNLYLDMNGVIHNCSHGAGTDVNTRMSEDEMMSKVFAYLDHLFRMTRPNKLLYMAIDGVAPRAKMNQQRSRRFRSASEAAKDREEARRRGEPEPEGEPFDSNCITPGTEFMARLTEHLKFYVRKKQTEDPLWAKVTVILSGHEVRGEGEHKIMEHIRWARTQPGWEPNQTHCLYGLDADLIMLALVTHEPHFCLLREVVKFGGGEKGQPSREILSNPTDDGFILLHIGLLREYLDLEFREKNLSFGYDLERVIDDFILLCMLVGNDFLPALPTLNIAEGALNTLFKVYHDTLPMLGGYITGDEGGGTFNAERLEKIMSIMSTFERQVLEDRALDVEKEEEKKARRNKRFGDGSASELNVEEKFDKDMSEMSETDGVPQVSSDPVMMNAAKRAMILEGGEEGLQAWKDQYYREKLGLKMGEAAPLAEIRQAYFDGLNWVLRYYYRGVASWTWYYPYHYAPMASDLCAGMERLTSEFDYGEPFRPFEQLMAVQPPSSSKLLPEPFRHFMEDPRSPLAEFFPEDIPVDFEGKRNDWEGVVLLPFLDADRLKAAVASVEDSQLTAGEIARNKPGHLIFFNHAPGGAGDVQSTLPKSFAGLFPAKSKMTMRMPPGEFPDDVKCFGGEDSVFPGTKIGLDSPSGFPTVRTLPVSGTLKNAGVKVFGNASKKESLVIQIDGVDNELVGDLTGSGASDIAAVLLNKRVQIKWPYLQEALVVGVSDAKERIVPVPGKPHEFASKPNNSSEWGAEMQKVTSEYLAKYGVAAGRSNVALHCRACEGLVRHPDGSLQKRFAKTEMMVPIQLVIAKHNAPSSRMEERPALDAGEAAGDFQEGDIALYLGRSYFGALAVVTDVSPSGLGVSLHPVPLDTGVSRRILNGVGQRYMSGGEIARKLGVHPKVIGCITGAVWAQENAKAPRSERIDIGLNLKHNGKMLCVAGFCRPTQGDKPGWEYSQEALRVLQEYKRAHAWVFAAVEDIDDMRDGVNIEDVLADLPESGRLATLKGTKAWLKAHPIARRPLVPTSSQVATEEAVRALVATTAGGTKAAKVVDLEGVSPLLLMKAVTEGSVVDLYAGGDFELGDRVVMVGDSGQPSFGSRGAIVAIHSYTDAHTQDSKAESVEVLFDEDFVGGTDLHGVISSKRGAMLPVAQLINLSHPPAMPNLGSAAPKLVVKDAKGDLNAPTQWSERAPKIQREPSPQPRLPENDSKGFDTTKGAGRGKMKKPTTKGAGSSDTSAASPAPIPSSTRMISMLNNASVKAAEAKAATPGKKAPLSIKELEAQMLQMMTPPKPAGTPPKTDSVSKKAPMSIKELEAKVLAEAKGSKSKGAPKPKESPNPPRMPRTKKPVDAPSPAQQPPLPSTPAPAPTEVARATADKSADASSDAQPSDAESAKPQPRRMIPRFLLRTGKSS